MDQFVSALAQRSSTLLVDCRSNGFESVPLDDPEIVFVVANSGIRHKNSDGVYAERVRQCREAVKAVREMLKSSVVHHLYARCMLFDERESFLLFLQFFNMFRK